MMVSVILTLLIALAGMFIGGEAIGRVVVIAFESGALKVVDDG